MKKIILFGIKCILVMVPVIWIILYAMNNLMAFTDQEAPYYIWNKEVCSATQEKDYNVVILGDSTANAAYMPELLSDVSINLALGGTTPMENYYVMQDYLENNNAPDIVYISFLDDRLQSTDCYWKRTLYSHRFSLTKNWEMLKRAKEYEELSIVTETSNLDFLAYEMFLPSKYITSLSNASFNQRYDGNITAYNLNSIHGGRYIARGNAEGEAANINIDSFYVAPLFDYYYKELIQLCVANGIKVHIIKLPLPDTITFSESYINQFNEYYADIQGLYPGVTVEWWDKYDKACFVDGWHLNTHGALKFSSELKKRYIEEFGSEWTSDQINGLNDSIKGENLLAEMFKWAACCSQYSLVIYDGIGQFEDIYRSQLAQDNLSMQKYNFSEEVSNVYVASASKPALSFTRMALADDYIEVWANGETKYDWNPYALHGIDIVVVDNFNKQVVCEKRFLPNQGSYFTLQG